MTTVNVTFEAYMQSFGFTGGLPEFAAQARMQSRQSWRPQFTAGAVQAWAMARMPQ